MAPFSKPETVLKQAEGLVSVGQAHAALQSLTEMFSSKRFRSTPLTSLEPIMHRFIELCVDMRKGRTAKEGLMQYKNIAQNTSVQSIESIIMRFVQLADAKVREAQEKAAVQIAVDVDDLEASETPESILLGAVSGDQSKDRTDRALVTPWLKFLWESYRTSLETLKNNARLEAIYQQIAQQAFKFCLKHQRKVEFRRLCETLRLHLANVAKYSHQPHSINLSDPDTLQHHLDTRFAQLNTSVELELWQEAFRSVEDVHNLLTMAKKAPRPAMMANYYEKLTKIFLMSGNALYHAAAWGKYYAVVTSIGGKSVEELSKLAGQVLVSALAVPVGLQTDEPEEAKGKARLTSLLGLTKTPTRAGLLRDALSRDVLKLSPAPVKALYQLLEVTFDPLTLCSSIAPLLNSLSASSSSESSPSYAPYLPLLHQALLSRLLSHLSQIYSSIKISNLLSLVAPLKEAGVEGAYDDEQIEAYVMGCARRGELHVRVDHSEGCIIFIDEPFANTGADEFRRPSTSAVRDNTAIQPTLSEMVRTRLSSVALCLHKSLELIDAPAKEAEVVSEEEQKAKLTALVAAVDGERKALQLRRAIVARRRELLGELTARREKEEVSRRAEQSRREKEEEERKARLEMQARERERNRRELEQIRQQETDKLAKGMIQTGMLKSEDFEEQNLDTGDLINLQVQHIEKEKREISQRLRVIAKRIDHLERGYRKEERPLVAQDYERQQANDRETFNSVQAARTENARAAHQEDIATKKRLSRITDDYLKRKEVLITKKGEEFARKRDAALKKIEEEKAKRRKTVFAQREAERKRIEEEERIHREKEEEERRREAERLAEEERLHAEEEAAAAAAEAAKREAEEKAAAVRKEREAERAAAVEQARLQAQREEEAEARRQARAREREQVSTAEKRPSVFGRSTEGGAWRRSTPTSGPGTPTRAANPASTPPRAESPSPAVGKYRPGALGGGGGGWREREAAKTATAQAGTAPSPQPAAPATPAPANGAQQDDDGFQVVQEKKNVWRPRRGRG
ncbi:eukaryotic translation initiation factor 3 subunit [Moniliophthora roreri MCA 2997]|uniref:Eukaryotic translation initiation factor 3 subunit A n=1 Tax=Moniliophthora roreri (strain MCA 2997) TaxID=1381753 RepID=V2XDN4_MONRO|nr:eukaryotic translation initiation factor 3 subunit [Moniliophthora roreri MCA 2997]